jgi:glucosylglycerate hydrolase
MQSESLRNAALAVLHNNDSGGWTKPAPHLYPHQWSWDSAFIAIGLAHVDLDRALRELEALFGAQWADGRVPHIAFNPHAAGYFPGPEWWASASISQQAPRTPATSGLIQPPVHALALRHILRLATRSTSPSAPPPPAGGPPSPAAPHQPNGAASRQASRGAANALPGAANASPGAPNASRGIAAASPQASPRGAEAIGERVRELYPRLLAWHRYLAVARDPHAMGLLLVYHPWESGTDNSPRWDAALSRVKVGQLPTYRRHDLQHVADPSERPTHDEYDRYLWLVESLKQAAYDDRRIQVRHPFLVGDVLMSAIFACACTQLAEIGKLLSRPEAEFLELTQFARRFTNGVLRAWDAELSLALDFDVRAAEHVRVASCAGLAPLLLPELEPALLGQVVERLRGPDFAGANGLAFPVVPSTAPGSAGFSARSYWRGPAWPVANWLLWYGLRLHGQRAAARNLRAANLAMLSQPTAQFAEYFEPYTAEPLGSLEQSWTAAVALDWLSADD